MYKNMLPFFLSLKGCEKGAWWDAVFIRCLVSENRSIRHIDSLQNTIIASVNHIGESDSIGSVIGNIMSMIYGCEAIEKARLFCLEGRKFEDTLELFPSSSPLPTTFPPFASSASTLSIDTSEKQQWYERCCEMLPLGVIL